MVSGFAIYMFWVLAVIVLLVFVLNCDSDLIHCNMLLLSVVCNVEILICA